MTSVDASAFVDCNALLHITFESSGTTITGYCDTICNNHNVILCGLDGSPAEKYANEYETWFVYLDGFAATAEKTNYTILIGAVVILCVVVIVTIVVKKNRKPKKK